MNSCLKVSIRHNFLESDVVHIIDLKMLRNSNLCAVYNYVRDKKKLIHEQLSKFAIIFRNICSAHNRLKNVA